MGGEELLSDLSDYMGELETELEAVQQELEDCKAELAKYENLNDPIRDSERFIELLKRENLYDKNLEEFINRYMRFYND